MSRPLAALAALAVAAMVAGPWSGLAAADGASPSDGGAAADRCAPDRITLHAGDTAHSFTIEIADDPKEQSRGLMFRPSLAADAGMLFVYAQPRMAAFWMKNTMIPLDMLFIDEAGRVVNIEAEAEPYTLTARRSDAPVLAVLEIVGGLAAELGIEPGAQAVHPAFRAAPAEHRCPTG